MSDMRQLGVVICRHPIENPKWNSKGGHLDAHCAYVAAPGPPGVRKLWPFWPMEDPGLVEPRGIKRHFERSYADGEWDRTASPNSQLPISCFHGSHAASLRAKRLGLLSFHRENHLGGKGVSRPIVVAMTSKLRARSACVSPAANRPATA
jgi:hypothetical protein